tara:strand:- start:1938 stop:2105 length:168 start_codon:yes stop_codon:yes gene_type:complete
VISEAEMIETLRQELAQAIQAMERLAELLRDMYSNEEGAISESIEEAFADLNLDL